MTDVKTPAAHAAPAAQAEHDKAAADKAAVAAKAKAEKEKERAEYEKLPEAERLRVDLAKLDTEPEDVMTPDAHMKRRQAILDRLRELYEPIVAPAPPPAPATAKPAVA